MKQITKRDGTVVPFLKQKIESAVFKALDATGVPSDSLAAKVAGDVVKELETTGREITSVEEVQDYVEMALMRRNLTAAAKAYILYRDEHTRARNELKVKASRGDRQSVTDAVMLIDDGRSVWKGWDRATLRQMLEDAGAKPESAAVYAKEVEDKLIAVGIKYVTVGLVRELANTVLLEHGAGIQLADDCFKVPVSLVDDLMATKSNENSNIVANNPEAVNLAISELVLKNYALRCIFSEDVARAHATGMVYIHDLGYPTRVYCGSHSIEYIKKYGLKGLNNLNSTSKPAKTASVLTGHINTFLASMQSCYAGALGLGFVNVFYAPLLEGLTNKEIHQVAQELVFNASQNAFSRGSQTLFIDVNVHSGVPGYLRNVPAIGRGGQYMFQLAGSCIRQPLHETMCGGDWCLALPDGTLALREHCGEQEQLVPDKGRVLTYGDFEPLVREFAMALLDIWYDGDANGRIFEFPKCDFHVSAETLTDPEQRKVYDRACELAAHNGSTYFVFDREAVTLSSCCRLRTTVTDTSLLRHPERLRTSFPRNEPIVIRQNGEVQVLSMGRLFDECDAPIVDEDGFEVKYLYGVETWDRAGWTGLQCVMRHAKTPKTKSDKLLSVRLDNGALVVVTPNHPMVTNATNRLSSCRKCGFEGTLTPFGTTAYGKPVFKCPVCGKYSVGPVLTIDTGNENIVEASQLNRNLALAGAADVFVDQTKVIEVDEAYILGAYVGDGSLDSKRRVIYISKPEEHQTTKRVREAVQRLTGKYPVWSSGACRFAVTVCPEVLQAGNHAYLKQLPPDYLSWTKETMGAVLSGLMDTDGFARRSDLLFSSVSRVLLVQIQMYLRRLGIFSKMYNAADCGTIDNALNGGAGINKTHLPYSLEVPYTADVADLLKLSWKASARCVVCEHTPKWEQNNCVRKVVECIDDVEAYVYDVTTDSHTFVVNGIVQHNCGFQNVTVNVPQAAYRAASYTGTTDLGHVLDEIDKAMDIAVEAHLQKKAFIEKIIEKPGRPLWQLGKPSNDGSPYIDLKSAMYIIGVIGVNDAVKYICGKEMHESPEAMDMGLEIAGHMFLRAKEYTKKYGLQFKIEESPAESAARKLAKADLRYWRDDALQVYKGGDEDHAYYTNSIHLAAEAPVSLLERIDAQAKFNPIIEAGAITHAFIGEQQPDPKAIASLIESAFLRTQSAQITFSPEFTYCEACGHNSRGLHTTCPKCGSDKVFGETRIVGYFSRINNFNLSKLAELRARERGTYAVEQNGFKE